MLVKHEFSTEIKDFLKPLHVLNNFSAPFGVIGDSIVIAAAVAASQWNMWLYPFALLIIGSRQRALASLLHESCHKTLTRDRHLNNFLGRWFLGFPIFQSHQAYVKSHVLNHHNFLGDERRDPDYVNYIESGLFDAHDRLDFIVRFVFRTLLLLNVKSYLRYLLTNRLSDISSNRKEMIGLVVTQTILFGTFYTITGSLGYIVYWIIPFITTFQVIGWFSEISEHYPVIRTKINTLTITRNRFPNWVERLIIGMHGDNYHLVHHLFPGIPFWNLKFAHQILLKDSAYEAENKRSGGIFTAPAGRQSVMRSILNEIRDTWPEKNIKKTLNQYEL